MPLLEVFLFVNPIGTRCHQTEALVTKLARASHRPFKLHFIPLVDFQLIDDYMVRMHLNPKTLSVRNHLLSAAYRISLDYKAAQCQGNKKARLFLSHLQEEFVQTNRYTPEAVDRAIAASGLDREAFFDTHDQDDLHQAFLNDQQIAREMNVTATPTTVIYDTNQAIKELAGTQGDRLKRLVDGCEHVYYYPEAPQLLHVL